MYIALTTLEYFDPKSKCWEQYASIVKQRFNIHNIVRYGQASSGSLVVTVNSLDHNASSFKVKESPEDIDNLVLASNGPVAKVLFGK